MESDKYLVLKPPDYLAFLRKYPGHNPIKDVCNTQNKIILWVKCSILHYEETEKRSGVLKFFINAALVSENIAPCRSLVYFCHIQECRKLRNFSSAAAISTALHSREISRLRLTISDLSRTMQEKLSSLDKIFDPLSDHHAYRLAIKEGNTQEHAHAIPWLGENVRCSDGTKLISQFAAVHLKELQLVLRNNPITVEVDQERLINFQRYVKFMDQTKELFRYKTPDLELYRHDGRLEYLEGQLRSLEASKKTEDQVVARSLFLERRENVVHTAKKAQLRALGFKK